MTASGFGWRRMATKTPSPTSCVGTRAVSIARWRAILADETEAWDVVQMAFLKAWQRLDRYNPRYSFTTWLYRIGTNLAIDLLRSRTSRDRAHKAGTEHRLRLVGQGETAAAKADGTEADSILKQLVQVLTPQQRSAFVLREMQGLETAEVAEVLGCSATTVRNHVFQARKALRREMQPTVSRIYAGIREGMK